MHGRLTSSKVLVHGGLTARVTGFGLGSLKRVRRDEWLELDENSLFCAPEVQIAPPPPRPLAFALPLPPGAFLGARPYGAPTLELDERSRSSAAPRRPPRTSPWQPPVFRVKGLGFRVQGLGARLCCRPARARKALFRV